MLISDSNLNHDNIHHRAGFVYSNHHPHLAYRYDPVEGTFATRKATKVGIPKNSDGVPWMLLKKITEDLDAASGGKASLRTTTMMTAHGIQDAIEVWAWVPEQNPGTIGVYLNHMLCKDAFDLTEKDAEMMLTGNVEAVHAQHPAADQI